MLGSIDAAELASRDALIEVLPDLRVGHVAHATPEGIAHEEPLIGDSLALEAAFLGVGDRLLRAVLSVSDALFRLRLGTLPGLGDDASGLVAVHLRDLVVRRHYLVRGEDFFTVARTVRCDLGGFRTFEAVGLEVLADLLGARAGGVQVLAGETLDLGSTASAGLELITEVAQAEGQLGVVNRRGELLGVEERPFLLSVVFRDIVVVLSVFCRPLGRYA